MIVHQVIEKAHVLILVLSSEYLCPRRDRPRPLGLGRSTTDRLALPRPFSEREKHAPSFPRIADGQERSQNSPSLAASRLQT